VSAVAVSVNDLYILCWNT